MANDEAADETQSQSSREWSMKPGLAICTALLLAASTTSVLSFKMQGKLGFKQSLFQTFMMFIGDYTNMIIFGALMASDSKRFNHFLILTNEAKDKGLTYRFTKLWMVSTSVLNTLGSAMHLTALLLLPPSVYSCSYEDFRCFPALRSCLLPSLDA
jgi:hypothetical protein